MKTMRENIEFLKRDRSAECSSFWEKLKEVGFEIDYNTVAYWDYQPCVKVGERLVPMVEMRSNASGNMYCAYRTQNAVIRDIIDTIEEEVKKAERADEKVKTFFEKLSR